MSIANNNVLSLFHDANVVDAVEFSAMVVFFLDAILVEDVFELLIQRKLLWVVLLNLLLISLLAFDSVFLAVKRALSVSFSVPLASELFGLDINMVMDLVVVSVFGGPLERRALYIFV